MKLASLALLLHPFLILVGTAIASYLWATTADPGTTLAWLKNPGPHGFSEMLYEFSSAAAVPSHRARSDRRPEVKRS